MEISFIAIATFFSVLILLFIGMKIGVVLAIVGILGFYFFQGNAGMVAFIPFQTANSFVLTAVPLFIFMGEIMVRSGISEKIYTGASKIFAFAPGSLLHSSIWACAGFSAISGSSPATAATIGTVAIPALRQRGYDEHIILGTIAAGGTLGILIPPSINLIVYGMLADTSVGRLFAGGIMPGIILTVLFSAYVAIRAMRNPDIAPKEIFGFKLMMWGALELWPFLVLMVIILGGIFGGVFTPTEAAAVSVFSALCMALFFRRLSLKIIWDSLWETMQITCMILFVVVGATILSSFIARAGIPKEIYKFALSLNMPDMAILLVIYFLYMFLGCFIDPISMMVLTMGVVLPIVQQLGYDLVWFGVVIVLLSEMAMLTPPVGVNLFVIKGISGKSLNDVFIGSLPFLLILIGVLALLTISPKIVLFLPSILVG